MLLVALAVVGVASASVVAVQRSAGAESDDTVVVADPPQTASVELGDLTTTVSLDGSVELADTTTVVHRIEGETASSSSSSSSGSSAAAPAAASVALPAEACPPDSTVPAETTTTSVPAAPTATTAVPTETSTATVPTETTTTTVAPPETTTTVGADPATTDCPTTAPSTSLPRGGIALGGAPGAGAPSGAPSGGSGSTSSTRTTQVVTSVVAVGTVVGLGDPLYTVDGSPVVAFTGALPAWRSLSTDSDDGPDIAQLEQSLLQLGYDADGELIVDDTYDHATETAVEQWQQGLGVEATGEVALGAVAFVPAAARVSSVVVAVGDEIGEGDAVVTLDTDAQQILATVPEEDQQVVVPGITVDVEGQPGAVISLRSSTTDGVVSVVAVVATTTPLPDATDGSAVSVEITTTEAAAVLVVPVEAIASRLDGSYAVQVVEPDGIRWITVEIVGQAGTRVGVRGDDLVEGTEVVVPD